MRRTLLAVHVFITLCIISQPACGQWKNLINKDLGNWVQLNGTAPYEVRDGVITGKTVLNSPNSFLCTKEKYGDFILEFDTWFDSRMNSGVQIRSESKPDFKDGRVHGYQVELDPSDRAWSGGIYDEARRGWLYTLDINPAGKKAYKKESWNHYRIEAIGNSIRTWVNGIPCADLIDDTTPVGFIALQVHSIDKDSLREGLEVKWKNIRIITKNVEKHATPYEPVIPQVSYLTNELSEREKAEGWKLLFDGTSNNGWRSYRVSSFPQTGWEIKDGTISIIPSSIEPKRGGDIVTAETFKDFELVFDFKYTKGANSGVKYFIGEGSEPGTVGLIGCEYQVLDDRNHPDAKAGINGNRTLSSLYDLIPAAKDKRDNGIDMWNRGTIIVRGNHVEHWLNGQKTLEYERKSPEWYGYVAKSKFNVNKGFAEVERGHLLLQDHTDRVYYRNIKIKEL